MIVVCYGSHKTGSTLCFKLVSELLEHHGHSQATVPEGAITPDKVQNFANRNLTESDGWAEVLESQSQSDQFLAIKTHGDCSDRVRSLVLSGKVKVIANTRDPRDTYLALRDAGKKNKKGAFSRLTNAQRCIDNISASFPMTSNWMIEGSAVFDYHAVAFDTISFLKAVNEYLNLPGLDQAAYRHIIDQVDKKDSPTRNLGIPNRFLRNMTAEQAIYYTGLFRDQLYALSDYYKKIGLRSEYFYPMLEMGSPCYIQAPVTRKTFVVLGCPRGGTSLVAGALAASGIFMGHFATNQYEDPDFKIKPRDVSDINVESRLMGTIRERNEKHEFWGWKVPNNIYYVDQIRHLLINPVFIFIYRDVESIARSSANHDGKNWFLNRKRLLSVAKNHTARVRSFEESLGRKENTVVFQLEDIQRDIGRFMKNLAAAIAPVEFDDQRLRSFVSENGGYRALPEEARV